MTIRLYFDEDSMDKDLVRALRVRGVNVLTALEADMIERPDELHLRFAAAQGRTIFSFNVGDFCRLHGSFVANNEEHGGIIVAKQQTYSVGGAMRRLLQIIGTVSAAAMRNRLEFLSQWGEFRI